MLCILLLDSDVLVICSYMLFDVLGGVYYWIIVKCEGCVLVWLYDYV